MWRTYKIISNRDANTVYIGSTKEELNIRLSNHRTEAKRRNSRKCIWIRENNEHLVMIEISTHENRVQALHKEDQQMKYHMDRGYNVLNERYVLSGKRVSRIVGTANYYR